MTLIGEGAQAEPAWAGDGRLLEPGEPVLCELTGSAAQAHRTFRILLEAGQFLHLTVEQPEIDLSVVLWSPEQEPLLKADVLPGGDERLFYVAPETGEYGLVVSALDGGQAGSYRVTLEAVRRPSEADHRQAEATGIFAQGERYLAAGEYRCAGERYEKALELWRQLGDSVATLETLNQIGAVQAALGDSTRAHALWTEKVLPGWRGTPREAPFLIRVGRRAFSRLDTSPALSSFRRALEAAHEHGQHIQEMQALRSLIDVYRARGEIQQGFDTFRTAFSLARSEHDRSELFGAMGDFFLSLGDSERSLQFYTASLLSPGEPRRRAHLLAWKGMAELQLERYRAAEKTLRTALALARSPGVEDQGIAAQALSNLGTLYCFLYEEQGPDPALLQEAQQAFEEARPLAKRAGDGGTEAIATSYLGRILDLRGQEAAAIELYTRAYEQFSAKDFIDGMTGALHGRARARRDLGQLEGARRDIEQVMEILESYRSQHPTGTARAVFFSNRHLFYEFQIELLQELNEKKPNENYAAMAFEKSEAFRARSLLEDLVEQRQPEDTQPDLRQKIEEIEAELRQVNPLLLLAPEEAIGSRLDVVEARTRDLLVQWEILRADLRGRSVGSSRKDLVSVTEIQRHLDDDTLILAYMPGEDQGYVWSIGKKDVHLDPLPRWREIEKRVRIVAKLLAESYEKGRRERWEREAAQLSEDLLAPVAEHLGRRRLVIVRDGDLYNLPFDVLPDPRRRSDSPEGPPALLMDSHEVLYAPSASVLVRILEKSRRRPPAPRQLAAFGDAVFGPDDPRVSKRSKPSTPASGSGSPGRMARDLRQLERLPASHEEVENITRPLPEGQFLKIVGFEARRERLLEPDLAQYRILHLATHSRIDPAFPELSSLVFSMVDEAGQPQNGLLTFYEISDLELNIDMVVLSACRTASGKRIKGEGVIGLGRAFLHAGASRVVVSLWNVDDEATAFLMKRFYEGMFDRKLTPPEALRQARLAVRSRPEWRAPYYWAPFVLEGDWH